MLIWIWYIQEYNIILKIVLPCDLFSAFQYCIIELLGGMGPRNEVSACTPLTCPHAVFYGGGVIGEIVSLILQYIP